MAETSLNSIPDNLNEKWKEKFLIIEKYYNNGNMFSLKKNIDKTEWKKERKKLIKLDASFFLAGLFGPLYYLFKGLWLKAIIYTVLLVCLITLIETFLYSLSNWAGLSVIWAFFAPFDYYRLKVLKKQW